MKTVSFTCLFALLTFASGCQSLQFGASPIPVNSYAAVTAGH